MAMTDDAMMRLCDAMREQYGAGVEFELSLGELVGRYRREFDRRQQDAEAARLLPLGPDACMERLGVKRRTVYYMAERHRKRRATETAPIARIGD